MSNYLLYKPLKYLRKMFSFEQNMAKTLGGCFFAPPCTLYMYAYSANLV